VLGYPLGPASIAFKEAAMTEANAVPHRPPMLTPPATMTVTTTAETTTVTVAGELDMGIAERLRSQLATEIALRPRAVILDLSDVTFCATCGLSVLLTTSADAQAAGIPYVIVAAQRAVVRPIMLLRLDEVLQIHRTVAEALDWLAILPSLTAGDPTIEG
jgi:anti-anti-sigma factor